MSKYTKEILEEAVASAQSVAGVLRQLGLKVTGGSQAYISRLVKDHSISTAHFLGQGHRKGKRSKNRVTPEQILVKGEHRTRSDRLKRVLLETGREELCEGCQIGPNWNNKLLCLQVDHINGDPTDNRLENLRILCPNCHSQTATFGTKNRRRGGVVDTQR